MNTQLIVVGVCVIIALFFMGKKIFSTLKRKGGCSCEAPCRSANRCYCDGECSENKGLTEIKPK
ncbi:MAG: hypothetical protein K2H64_09525 [Desulfovibrio sp.]|nr:hypothetical protein [Desulfovibrio sp.]